MALSRSRSARVRSPAAALAVQSGQPTIGCSVDTSQRRQLEGVLNALGTEQRLLEHGAPITLFGRLITLFGRLVTLLTDLVTLLTDLITLLAGLVTLLAGLVSLLTGLVTLLTYPIMYLYVSSLQRMIESVPQPCECEVESSVGLGQAPATTLSGRRERHRSSAGCVLRSCRSNVLGRPRRREVNTLRH